MKTCLILYETQKRGKTEEPSEHGELNTTVAHLEDGERVEIYCDDGYSLYGDAVISCQKGSWSGLVTPECRPEDGKISFFLKYEKSTIHWFI